jgi:hypothetical protein
MNKLTVLKASVSAAAIIALGASASLAANTNVLEVTVTPVQSLTLVSTCDATPMAGTFLNGVDNFETTADNGLDNGTPVRFTLGTAEVPGISESTTYYVINAFGPERVFGVAETPSGAPVDLAGTPGGVGTTVARDCANSFDVEGTMERGHGNPLVNAQGYDFSLDYTTDWDNVVIDATLAQTGGAVSALAGDGTKLSITVAAAEPTDVGPGIAGGTKTDPQVFQSAVTKDLIENIDGLTQQVTANSALTFRADAGYSAPIQTSAFTVTYGITPH